MRLRSKVTRCRLPSKRFPNYRSGLDLLYDSWGVKVGGPGTRTAVLVDPKNTTPIECCQAGRVLLLGARDPFVGVEPVLPQ